MADDTCTNQACIDRDTQLRLARIREELLTNFNGFLIDRIRFLEQTINQLSVFSSSNGKSRLSDRRKSQYLTPTIPQLRRSSSATAVLLQNPSDFKFTNTQGSPTVRSCPSSVDLLENPLYSSLNRTKSSIPMHHQWICSSNDLNSQIPLITNDKGRLESRRFACDVDDNDLRAFKAMVYMEQARKHQPTRPLHRLRQVFRISHSNTSSMSPSKK